MDESDDIPDISTHDMSPDHDHDRENPHYRELLNFLSDSSMKDTAKSSVKQSIYAASGAFMGSFMGGPVGGLIGGVAGSVVGYVRADDYDGAILALTELESEKQKRLVNEVVTILKASGATFATVQSIDVNSFRETLYNLAQQEHVRNGIWNACLQSTRS